MFDQMQLLETPRAAVVNKMAAKLAFASPARTVSSDKEKQPKAIYKSVDEALSSIFPTQQEENQLMKAKRVMGELVADLSDEELESYLTEFEFLLDEWLDEFEKKIFNNKTLMNLLQEG